LTPRSVIVGSVKRCVIPDRYSVVKEHRPPNVFRGTHDHPRRILRPWWR